MKKRCLFCEKEFFTYKKEQKFCNNKCKDFYQSGKNHYNWKGGKHQRKDGYTLISVGNGKRNFEHRLIIERFLGRKLKSTEQIHHLNGIRDDNRIENLALLDSSKHERNTLVKLQAERIRELEGVIRVVS